MNMRFEDQLQANLDQEWKDKYINYKLLKDIIADILENKPKSEKKFSEHLEKYWKVHDIFINEKVNFLLSQTSSKNVLTEMIRVNDFINLNQEGFRKIIKKHDKNSNYKLYPAWQWKLKYNPITKMYGKIKEISKLYEVPQTDSVINIIDNEEFKRKSIKFWVEKKNILKVIFHIAKHLPIYIYDEDINDHIYQYISSVYFDNRELEFYHKRVVKLEGSKIVRIRWYENDNSNLFVERKIHHDSWTTLSSIKERFQIKSNKLRYLLFEKMANMKQGHPGSIFSILDFLTVL